MDHIAKNQGCTVQDVVKGVEKFISRKTVFKILHELKKDGVVIDEKDKDKPNRRDHKLFLDTNNLLVLVPRELEEFKSHYLVLVNKVMKKVRDVQPSQSEKIEDTRNLLAGVIDIFHMLTNAYLFRSIINWPRVIHDVETLNKLYTITLTKMVEIQSNLSLRLGPSLGILPTYNMFTKECSPARIIQYNPTFRKFNIEKEVDQVIGEIRLERLYGVPDRKVFPS
jgi:hypothetical protein